MFFLCKRISFLIGWIRFYHRKFRRYLFKRSLTFSSYLDWTLKWAAPKILRVDGGGKPWFDINGKLNAFYLII